MRTVLPTPAPPKSPTFPPFMNGARRSTALMPVSNNSAFVLCLVKCGTSRCIGKRAAFFGAGSPSIGSPTTLNMRPSAASPTGTLMAAPVSVTSASRARPAVSCIAIQRTRFSPRCCATSSVSVCSLPDRPGCEMVSAFLMEGREPSNRTSTTGPII